jgi:hypothetical protein
MKTLTTLTAVAALIAGISFANAQATAPKPGATGNSAMGLSKRVATGTGKYCIETSPGGALNCKYASLAACQKDAKANNRACSPNPNPGTTGSK